MTHSRRHFLAGVGAATVTASIGVFRIHATASPALLYPPTDLSYFDIPMSRSGEIALGAIANIFEGGHLEAIDTISSMGYGRHSARFECPERIPRSPRTEGSTRGSLPNVGSSVLRKRRIRSRFETEVIDTRVRNARKAGIVC